MKPLEELTHLPSSITPWLILTTAAMLGILVWWVLFFLLHRFSYWRADGLVRAVITNLRAPLAFIFPILAIRLTWQPGRSVILANPHVDQITEIILIGLFAWLAIGCIYALSETAVKRHPAKNIDDLQARKIETQFGILRRVASVIVWVFAIGLMLFTFPRVRTLGATLFASAGAAGLVLGLAARPVLTNLFAGIQIALTQPIRLGDSITLNNQQGTVEEITATYAVIRLQEMKRLIVPVSYFLDQPFTNCSRRQVESLTGTVVFYVDYTASVEALRHKLQEILAANPLWNKSICSLSVTNLTERVIELTARFSAANPTHLTTLQDAVREALVLFMQQTHTTALPRTRIETTLLSSENDGGQRGIRTPDTL